MVRYHKLNFFLLSSDSPNDSCHGTYKLRHGHFLPHYFQFIVYFFCGTTDQFGPSPPPFEAYTSNEIRHTRPIGLLRTSYRLITQTATKQHTTNPRTSKLSAGFEFVILAIKRPQTYALNRMATVKFKFTHFALLAAKLN